MKALSSYISNSALGNEMAMVFYRVKESLYVLNFNVAGYILFSFFVVVVEYVPVKGEIIWYVFLTTWLISLSIMLIVRISRGEWGGDSGERGL